MSPGEKRREVFEEWLDPCIGVAVGDECVGVVVVVHCVVVVVV